MEDKIKKLKDAIKDMDYVLIGAGAGLSTSAGLIYDGERFDKYFFDMKEKYNMKDMYTGSFYKFEKKKEFWAFFSRAIYINRYLPIPKPEVFENLLKLVKNKNYFVITTNVDHVFQKSGFDKNKLFYTQGDYGNFQCSKPCNQETFDNKELIEQMIKDQGFVENNEGFYDVPKGKALKLIIDSKFIPHCKYCNEEMTYHLRGDDKFVEDKGWHEHAKLYQDFLNKYSGDGKKILFLELGVGYNTPGIIKYPFWKMTYLNKSSWYASINLNEADAPEEIRERSICIEADIGEVLKLLNDD